jgi:putative GTP pyrophosphokinase
VSVATTELGYSRKRIDKSGRLVRDFAAAWRQESQEVALDRFDLEDVGAAIRAMEAFRAFHARPLARVNAGLRYYVRKAGMTEPDVTQRLKRSSTILNKLQREPTMQLSKMEDIGGVRAILDQQRQVDEVRRCLERAPRWEIRRVRDYVSDPKADGYRAVHIIVVKDGCYIEIQLRTPWQDAWAQSVEQDTRRLRAGLKFGAGPADLRRYYRLVSELFAMREQDIKPDQGFMEELAEVYDEVRGYFPAQDGD